MPRTRWGMRTSRSQVGPIPEVPGSQWLALCLALSAFLTAGCPQSSVLLDTIAGDPLVGRAPADDSGSGNDSGSDTADDPTLSGFEARMAAEFRYPNR